MKWFKLVFKQNKPLHIGSSRWGVICETEIFIPGWTMWGAITAEYLRRNSFARIDEGKEYFKVITNFYPGLAAEKSGESGGAVDFSGLEIMFPHYKKGRFFMGERAEEDFRFYLTDILMSTAVEGITRRAKDMSLHEMEYILHQSKKNRTDEKTFQVYWIGIIGLEDKMTKEKSDIEKFLTESPLVIYAGGERKYGLGELEMVYSEKADEKELTEWNLDERGNLNLVEGRTLRNFLPLLDKVRFSGEIVTLVDLNFEQAIPLAEKAEDFIRPGSVIKDVTCYAGQEYKLLKGMFAGKSDVL